MWPNRRRTPRPATIWLRRETRENRNCTKSDKLGAIQKDDSFYSSTESLYQSISTNTKISGSLKGAYTLGASVDAVTNNVASGETEVQGLSLNLKAYSLSSALTKDCINNKPLVEELVKDFDFWKKYGFPVVVHGRKVIKIIFVWYMQENTTVLLYK